MIQDQRKIIADMFRGFCCVWSVTIRGMGLCSGLEDFIPCPKSNQRDSILKLPMSVCLSAGCIVSHKPLTIYLAWLMRKFQQFVCIFVAVSK